MLTATPIDPTQDPGLRDALARAKLPTSDLIGRDRHFFGFRNETGELVGYGGLELHGRDGLLRAVVVSEPARDRGHGRMIVEWLCGQARGLGIERLYALPTDTASFFELASFQRAERASAPASIASSTQFTETSPSDSILMCRELR